MWDRSEVRVSVQQHVRILRIMVNQTMSTNQWWPVTVHLPAAKPLHSRLGSPSRTERALRDVGRAPRTTPH